MRLLCVTAALPLALALAGCGGTGINAAADPSGGKELFQQKCGSCHTLADAGTSGKLAPDLDAAFARSRKDGLGVSSIREVVRAQIEYAIQHPTSPGDVVMPNRKALGLTDAQADSIAAYVASVAGAKGATGAAPPPPAAGGGSEGKQVFAKAGCGSCHTLKDAGSTGTIGPNLDQAKPSEQLVIERVTNGKSPMPSFKGQLTEAEIKAVAKYVSSVAGK